MGFFKKYFEDTSYEYSTFYMGMFILFFSVFIIYSIYGLRINKNVEQKMKNIPLEDK